MSQSNRQSSPPSTTTTSTRTKASVSHKRWLDKAIALRITKREAKSPKNSNRTRINSAQSGWWSSPRRCPLLYETTSFPRDKPKEWLRYHLSLIWSPKCSLSLSWATSKTTWKVTKLALVPKVENFSKQRFPETRPWYRKIHLKRPLVE